jgi:hypothetical protein
VKWQERLVQTMADGQLSWMWRLEEKIGETDQYRLSPFIVISSFGEGSEFERFADFVDHLREKLPKTAIGAICFWPRRWTSRTATDLKERYQPAD